MNETFTAKRRNDKRKTPHFLTCRRLTPQECKSLHGHALYLDLQGNIAEVKITSIKTWKTRPEIEVHCKYGMYEYFSDTITPTSENIRFVTLVEG